MAEPEIYDIFDQETQLLAQRLNPRRVFLGMDEVRMGGTCQACAGRDMGELLGQCVTRQAQAGAGHAKCARSDVHTLAKEIVPAASLWRSAWQL
jgi:hypothetical protein